MQPKIEQKSSRRIQYRKEVLQLCFDKDSINNFKPGLKMIYASEEHPLFVDLKELKRPV